MTQQELAKILGTTQATISRWFSGQSKPTGLYKTVLQKDHPEVYKRIISIHEERNGISN